MSALRIANTSLSALRATRARVPEGHRQISRIGATLSHQTTELSAEEAIQGGPPPFDTASEPPSVKKDGKEIRTDGTQASYRGGTGLKGLDGEDKPQPKVLNQSVPGIRQGLNEQQKREVDQHNKEFENSHEIGRPAPEDKVDKQFWQRQ